MLNLKNKISFGILGATEVANNILIKPAKEIENVIVKGIASEDQIRAEKFAQKYKIPNVYPNYTALIESKEIDVIYIPLITRLHTQWIIKAIEAKKHVLVEKPICLGINEINSIKNAIAKNRVEILEGLMVQHHPLLKKIKEFVTKNIYGELLSTKTKITIPFSDDYVNSFANKGGGVFIHNSVYWLQLVQSCFGLTAKSYEGLAEFIGLNEIDIIFNARLNYDNDKYSTLDCSWKDPYKFNHYLYFENAFMRINNFIKPAFGKYKLSIDISNFKSNKTKKIIFEPQNYYTNQLFFFLKVITGIEENIPLNESFERIKIMEKIYKKAKNNTIVAQHN